MRMGSKILLIMAVMGVIGFVGIGGAVLWGVGVRDSAIGLENQFQAALSNREIQYDNMVKQVQEKFAVAKLDRQTIIDMIEASVAGRQGGSLFKSFQESSPNFTMTENLFKEVMATIGGKRDEFARSQQTLAQLQAEHANLRTRTITSFIVGSRPPLEFTVVSSSRAKGVIASGEDNENLISDKEKGESGE